MEEKELSELQYMTEQLWADFSDASEFRKEIDAIYGKMLQIRSQLYSYMLEYKLNQSDLQKIKGFISDIDNFYHTDVFPTWKEYRDKADEYDYVSEHLRKLLTKF